MGINHLLTGMILQVGPLLWVISVYWATTFGSKIKTRAAFLRFFLQEDVAYPPKFNSEFAPEKFPAKFWKVVFKAPFFRGELLNFSGVDFRVAFVFALFFWLPQIALNKTSPRWPVPKKRTNIYIYIYIYIWKKSTISDSTWRGIWSSIFQKIWFTESDGPESQYPMTGEAILRWKFFNKNLLKDILHLHLHLRLVCCHGFGRRCPKVRDASCDVSTASHDVSAGDVGRVAEAEDT